jgi:flavin-dependent dehydrogenase
MKYDVIIVGAGPAGSTTAKFLAQKGLKTLLLDKEKFPRDKPCGGGLPIRVLQRFPYVVTDAIIESYSLSGTVFSPSLQHRIEINKKEPILAMTLRKKFDYELVKFATDAGAVFQDGTSVSSVQFTNNTAQVIMDQGKKIESEIIVGADGINSTIAQRMGLRTSRVKEECVSYKNLKLMKKLWMTILKKHDMDIYIRGSNRLQDTGGFFPKKNI